VAIRDYTVLSHSSFHLPHVIVLIAILAPEIENFLDNDLGKQRGTLSSGLFKDIAKNDIGIWFYPLL